jgi:hypothetical protein
MPTQVWPIVAVIFFYFSVLFWRFSIEPIRMFHDRRGDERKEPESVKDEADKFATDFLHDFEGYLASINRTNKIRFRLSSAGFFVAGLTSLLALALDSWLT